MNSSLASISVLILSLALLSESVAQMRNFRWESLDAGVANAQAKVREASRNKGLENLAGYLKHYSYCLCLAVDMIENTLCLEELWYAGFSWWKFRFPRHAPKCWREAVIAPFWGRGGSRVTLSTFFWLASQVLFLSSLLNCLKKWGENFLR